MGHAAARRQDAPNAAPTRRRSRWGPQPGLGPTIAKSARLALLRAVDAMADESFLVGISPKALCVFAATLGTYSCTSWKSLWCDAPRAKLMELSLLKKSAFFDGHGELRELEILGHENYAPAGLRRLDDGSKVEDPSVPRCTKKVVWHPSPDGKKVVPSCPDCLWHHGGARDRLQIVSTRQLREAMRRSRTAYRVTSRDRARIHAVVAIAMSAPEATAMSAHQRTSLSLSILDLKRSSSAPGSLRAGSPRDAVASLRSVDAPSAPSRSPRPSRATARPSTCTSATEARCSPEPPRAIARPTPAPDGDAFEGRSAVPNPQSLERERALSGPTSTRLPPLVAVAITQFAATWAALGMPPIPAGSDEWNAMANRWRELASETSEGFALSELEAAVYGGAASSFARRADNPAAAVFNRRKFAGYAHAGRPLRDRERDRARAAAARALERASADAAADLAREAPGFGGGGADAMPIFDANALAEAAFARDLEDARAKVARLEARIAAEDDDGIRELALADLTRARRELARLEAGRKG